MAEQQQEQAINLGASLNIGVLMGSLMDLQQLLRTVPQIVARAQAVEAENEKLKAQLAALAPKAVEATADEAVAH